MTDQERQLIQQLADRIQKAPAPQVDRDADELIRRSLGARPDALYILTQTVLIQELALNQAKQQIEDLKRQQPPQSFLPKDQDPPRPQQSTPGGGYRSSSYQTSAPPAPAPAPPSLPQYAQQQYGQPDYQPQPQQGGRFSGFLQNAAQTAAGVVAGEVAFSALSSLFGHHQSYYGGGGGGFFGGGAPGISPVSETIINNNYYDTEREPGRFRDDDYNRPEHLASASNDSADYANDDAADDTTDDTIDDTTDVSDDLTDDDSSYDDGSDTLDV